jgi:tRNA threonylcarbamoyl adenosine modification protein (Sua5/YciO/YrdC/YwlC family)
MAQFITVHPKNPQPRLLQKAVEVIQQGGVIAYPTDSSYALACHIGDKAAMDTIRRIRQLDDNHDFTLVCKDLAQVSLFTKMGNEAFRLIKALTPGAFTFILDATKEVPRRLQHPKKKTIGIRIPDHAITQGLVSELGEALFSTTLKLPHDDAPLSDPYAIRDALDHELALIIDAGSISPEPSTIIAFHSGMAVIMRQGKGIADLPHYHD